MCVWVDNIISSRIHAKTYTYKLGLALKSYIFRHKSMGLNEIQYVKQIVSEMSSFSFSSLEILINWFILKKKVWQKLREIEKR